MDNANFETGEASTSNLAARRQQAREYRRRLLRSSSRTIAATHEDRSHASPTSAGTVEGDSRVYNRRLRVTPDSRWAFQAPQVPHYFYHNPRDYPICFAAPRPVSTAMFSVGFTNTVMSLSVNDSRWRVIRGDSPIPPDLNWARNRHRQEDNVVILESSPPSSPTSQLLADILLEPAPRGEGHRGTSLGPTGSDDEVDNGDFDVDAPADAEADQTEGIEGEVDPDASEVEEVEEADEEEEEEDEPIFDASAIGLKEISNLASFTVSSYKPGCGVKELRDDDVNQYWQSDGPQPHRLNIHFIKRVEIRALRLFLDYELDESYTPTKIQITAGTGPNLTIPFTTMELSMPKGWIDVPIAGAGGGPDGNSLCCFFVRVIILENHQNGKDTHIRGVKVFALDEGADTADNNPIDDVVSDLEDYQLQVKRMSLGESDEDTLMRLEEQTRKRKESGKKRYTPGDGGLTVPDFMREPEIR